MHRGERRGRRTFWVLLPIAAVLAGSTALAKNSEVARRLWISVAETVGVALPAERSTPAVRSAKERGARASARSASDPGNDVPSAPVAEVIAPPAPVEEPKTAVSEPAATAREPLLSTPSRRRRSDVADRSRAFAAAAASPSNLPPETIEPEAPAAVLPSDGEAASLHLYKDAYRLHFVEQHYAAALIAWDEYLRAVPKGRLFVEAHYNRAIALVRLGRRGEAEAALTPFARGEVSGGYRAREARELLDALNASSR
jgi:TolA-binding protein